MDIIEFLKAVFLGIVEGITEWLPISSTGHMILVDEFIKLNVTPEFKEFFLVVIQLGAILAVVVLYWGKLWPFYIREFPKKQRAIIAKQPVFARGIMTFVERFCDKEKWVLKRLRPPFFSMHFIIYNPFCYSIRKILKINR